MGLTWSQIANQRAFAGEVVFCLGNLEGVSIKNLQIVYQVRPDRPHDITNKKRVTKRNNDTASTCRSV